MEIFSAFGLDGRLLIANAINFLILVFVLHRFGYKPILKFVKTRQETIEQGVRNAQKAEERLREITEDEKKARAEAHREAQAIISRAREQAEERSASIIARAEEETKNIVARAKKEMRMEQEQALARSRQEVAMLAIAAAEQILRKKLTAKEDEQFIKDILKEV